MAKSINDLFSELSNNPEFAQESENLELPFQLAEQVICLRQMRNMTQAELAEKVGTKQSGISRLENMDYLPSLSFLRRVAEVLGAQIEIKLVAKDIPSC